MRRSTLASNTLAVATDATGRSLSVTLPPGVEGIDATVAVMTAATIHAAESDPRFKTLADILQHDPRRLWELCKFRFRFKADPRGIEHVRHPSKIMDMLAAGLERVEVDCDDVAAWSAAMLSHMAPRVYIIVAARGGRMFEHVYAGFDQDEDDGTEPQILAFDPQDSPTFGMHPPTVDRVRTYRVRPYA